MMRTSEALVDIMPCCEVCFVESFAVKAKGEMGSKGLLGDIANDMRLVKRLSVNKVLVGTTLPFDPFCHVSSKSYLGYSYGYGLAPQVMSTHGYGYGLAPQVTYLEPV
jgi:hypothetical protein